MSGLALLFPALWACWSLVDIRDQLKRIAAALEAANEPEIIEEPMIIEDPTL